MSNDQDIPFHFYNDTVSNVQSAHGDSLTSLDSNFPFMMANFDAMNEAAQADYPHRHDCYEVLFIREGEGTHVIDFENFPVKPNTFYFLSKDQIHFWQLSKPLQGNALLFTEEFIDFASSTINRAHDFAFFHHVGQAPYLTVPPEEMMMVDGLLKGLEEEFLGENKQSLSVLRAYMHILFTHLNRLYVVERPDQQHMGKASSLVRLFTKLVSENFITEHSVKVYAKKIGISTSHLTDTVTAVTGKSPGNIIRHKLALEAKRLLINSNITIAEVGYRLNFEDSSYFGRFFKKETGMSPAVFRQKIRDMYQITTE